MVYVPSGKGRRLASPRRGAEPATRHPQAGRAEKGGLIVRTAAEGASAEDIERDIQFLERLWKTIQERAEQVPAPALVYQEAELPLRVIRDLFTNDSSGGRRPRPDVQADRGLPEEDLPHMAEKV